VFIPDWVLIYALSFDTTMSTSRSDEAAGSGAEGVAATTMRRGGAASGLLTALWLRSLPNSGCNGAVTDSAQASRCLASGTWAEKQGKVQKYSANFARLQVDTEHR